MNNEYCLIFFYFYKTNSIHSTHLFQLSNKFVLWSSIYLKNKSPHKIVFIRIYIIIKTLQPNWQYIHKKTGEWQTTRNCIQVLPSFYWMKKKLLSSVIWPRNIYSLKLVEIKAAVATHYILPPSEKGIIKKGRFSPTPMYRKQKKGNMKPNENCNPSCPAKGKLLRLNPCDYHSLNQTAVVIIRHWMVEWLQFWSY